MLDAGPEGSVVFKFTIDAKYGNMNGKIAAAFFLPNVAKTGSSKTLCTGEL